MSMKFILFEKNCRDYVNYDKINYILTTRPTSVFTGNEILYESRIIAKV